MRYTYYMYMYLLKQIYLHTSYIKYIISVKNKFFLYVIIDKSNIRKYKIQCLKKYIASVITFGNVLLFTGIKIREKLL